jgi:L-lactate dehydrogenase complex protein LldF
VNFAIAETAASSSARTRATPISAPALPPLHIACLGIEKLIPRVEDLPVFLRLLARSATGQAITAYTSHFHGPRPGGELHLVIVDNGRSRLLADRTHRARARVHPLRRVHEHVPGLPAQRRSQLRATVPGPIGSVLEPARDPRATRACRSRAACAHPAPTYVPVRIDLHDQLLAWRGELVRTRPCVAAPAAPR